MTPHTPPELVRENPFKPASVLLKAKDDKSGKLLPGATVNIGTGDKTLLTLTTGEGTAMAKLAVNSRTGTDFWVRQTKAPEGYDLYKGQRDFKAKPGDPVTLTVTNTKTASPRPDPSDKPTDEPTEKPSSKPTEKPTSGSSGAPNTPEPTEKQTDSPWPDKTASSTAAPEPDGSLAATGADATPWLIGGSGVLLVVPCQEPGARSQEPGARSQARALMPQLASRACIHWPSRCSMYSASFRQASPWPSAHSLAQGWAPWAAWSRRKSCMERVRRPSRGTNRRRSDSARP